MKKEKENCYFYWDTQGGGGGESTEERFGNPYLLRRGPGALSGPVKGR